MRKYYCKDKAVFVEGTGQIVAVRPIDVSSEEWDRFVEHVCSDKSKGAPVERTYSGLWSELVVAMLTSNSVCKDYDGNDFVANAVERADRVCIEYFNRFSKTKGD